MSERELSVFHNAATAETSLIGVPSSAWATATAARRFTAALTSLLQRRGSEYNGGIIILMFKVLSDKLCIHLKGIIGKDVKMNNVKTFTATDECGERDGHKLHMSNN